MPESLPSRATGEDLVAGRRACTTILETDLSGVGLSGLSEKSMDTISTYVALTVAWCWISRQRSEACRHIRGRTPRFADALRSPYGE
jgi:hypothetical protein